MKRIAFTIAATLGLSVAHAQFFTGNELLAYMNGTANQKMIALGYVQGAYDSYLGVQFCPPANITAGQVQDMTKKFLDESPALRHHPANQFVRFTLRQTWPCDKREGTNL